MSSYYASINTNELRIRKISTSNRVTTTDPETGVISETITPITTYTASVEFTVWVSKEARQAGKANIKSQRVTIQQETLTGNIYELLYAKYKEDHPNSVDA